MAHPRREMLALQPRGDAADDAGTTQSVLRVARTEQKFRKGNVVAP